jgi:hypothetical protein
MSSIESIQKENAELREIIESNTDEIERCKSVIFQLVGGLFNQKTQKWIAKSHVNVLLGKKFELEEDEEDKVCSLWPTTRQGDDHEERMRKMEETIQKLEKQVEMMEKRQNECLKC